MKLQDLNPHNVQTDAEIDTNLKILLERLQALEHEYVKQTNNPPFHVNSGLRSLADQARINPKAMHSKHLTGAAADISDPNSQLWTWTIDNMPVVEAIGLWMEDKHYTPTWVHYQIQPPKSSKRIFIP